MSRAIPLIVSLIAAIILPPLALGQVITLNGTGTGRTFEGLGAVSAGASSRLLFDYPEPYRSQILDYLFKPSYGASLHHLKVEIGGDMNSTDGSEPSHMHSPTDQNYRRGYEWWLMREAKKRNPDIIFSALEWGAPGWIGNGDFFSQDNINYIINFIKGAQTEHGITISYVGIWNESDYKLNWIIDLKKALRASGLSTQIIAADQPHSQIFVDMNQYSALLDAVDVMGFHYPSGDGVLYGPTAGKRVWASEMGPWRGDWIGAKSLAKSFNRAYVGKRITSSLVWSPVSSYYDLFPLHGSGLMYANTPWSGSYQVQPAIWATAHTTQFAQPGWQYLDQASGYMGAGSYVALKQGSDFSIVIETIDASQNQALTFKITGGLSTGPIHVWTSNATNQFVQMSDIAPVNGSFTITVPPGSIYSLTSTTGQFKGTAAPPPSGAFPFPYSDTFDGYPNDQTGRYLSAVTGSFEIADCVGGRAGSCLRQTAPIAPIRWSLVGPLEPATVLGSSTWTDYQTSVDVFFEQPGTVKLISHMLGLDQNNGDLKAYQLYLDNAGNWKLCMGNNGCFVSGAVSLLSNSWHTLKLVWDRGRMQALINGVLVASITESRLPTGLAGFGVKGWTKAQFDNFRVDTVPGVGPIIPQSQMTPIVSSESAGYEAFKAIDGANATIWASAFTCVGGCRALSPLPQSITLSLGGTYKVKKLRYLPRQDGGNGGNITSYKVAVSTDGTTFAVVANGNWAADGVEKVASFAPIDASYIRLEATAALGGFAWVAEINVDYLPGGTEAENPVPTVSTLTPPSTNAGDSGFGLVVTGSNFVAGSIVRWNGLDRATTFVNAATLTANISATDIAQSSAVNVTVFNQAPGGGTSNAQTFIINPVTPPPPVENPPPPPPNPPPPDPPPPTPPVGGTASFVIDDSTTSGTWKGAYGAAAYRLAGDGVQLATGTTVTLIGQEQWTWAASTAEPRALQKMSASDRIAATWYTGTQGGSFVVDVNSTDGQMHQLAFYLMDWDRGGRAERITVADAVSNELRDSRVVSGFEKGKYLVWTFSGHIKITVTHTAGYNAILNGVFVDNLGTQPPPPPPPPDPVVPPPLPDPPPVSSDATAKFVNVDTTTFGSWKGVYGLTGNFVIGDASQLPATIKVTPIGQGQWTWAPSTTDPRALQKSSGAGRIAATWYTPTQRGSFSVDVNSTDGLVHPFALYMVDWDNWGRVQTITIFDAGSNKLLATQSVSGFVQGKYAVGTFSGHIKIVITNTGGNNGALSGLFF